MTPSNAKRSKAKNKFGGSSSSGAAAKDVGSSLAEKNERNKEASSGVAADSSGKDTIPAITIQEAAAAATLPPLPTTFWSITMVGPTKTLFRGQ